MQPVPRLSGELRAGCPYLAHEDEAQGREVEVTLAIKLGPGAAWAGLLGGARAHRRQEKVGVAYKDDTLVRTHARVGQVTNAAPAALGREGDAAARQNEHLAVHGHRLLPGGDERGVLHALDPLGTLGLEKKIPCFR